MKTFANRCWASNLLQVNGDFGFAPLVGDFDALQSSDLLLPSQEDLVLRCGRLWLPALIERFDFKLYVSHLVLLTHYNCFGMVLSIELSHSSLGMSARTVFGLIGPAVFNWSPSHCTLQSN